MRVVYSQWHRLESIIHISPKGIKVYVRSLYYSCNPYIVIVCPIESHYYYCCALTLELLYYVCQPVSFHYSCTLWNPIYTKEVLPFISSCILSK